MKLKGKRDILPAAPKNVTKPKKGSPQKKVTMEHWSACVSVWFQFTEQQKKERPTFDGASQKGLQQLIRSLKERANIPIWTEAEATKRLKSFLIIAYRDKWLRDNWLMKNINSQKDKVFFQKDTENNGRTSTPVIGKTIVFDRP